MYSKVISDSVSDILTVIVVTDTSSDQLREMKNVIAKSTV